MVRRILEEGLVTCWQEADNLLAIVFPALIAGPVGVVIADASPTAAILVIPVLLIVYFFVYAASIRATGLLSHGLPPDPLAAYRDILRAPRDLARVLGPGIVLLAATMAGMAFLSHQVSVALAVALGLGGAAVFMVWAAHHIFELPLILVEGVYAVDALETSRELHESDVAWNRTLLAAVSLPLVGVALVAWGIAAVIAPAMGAAIFALAVALWLPLAAFAVSAACLEWMSARMAATAGVQAK
jgi:hypothetical protein